MICLLISVSVSARTLNLIAGERISHAAGGCGCHTERTKGSFLAGGSPLPTPFGVFYANNITPDRASGIGSWSDEDFVRAMRERIEEGSALLPQLPLSRLLQD
jgi:hypothetical protein